MISVFISFTLSCLVLSSLSSSLLCLCLLSLLSFSQSFSVFFLRVMWCVSLCVVCCVAVCVVCGVWCGTLKISVSRLKTPPCVHSKRPVYTGNAHILFNMCAWYQYTQGPFECTHGSVFERTHVDLLNGHTESVLSLHTDVIVSSAYQNLPTYGHHVLQRFNRETHGCYLF